jgi:integrase
MDTEGKSMSHQQTLKTIMNHIFRWGINEGAIDLDIRQLPTRGVSAKRSSERLPEILTYEQVKILLYEAERLEHEWYSVWLFALLTGCRNGEIYALRWENVSLETGFIKICESYNNRKREFKSTKSGEYRTVPINKDLARLLRSLKLQTYQSGFVLPRLSGWKKGMQASVLRTFLISIGLPSVRFHTLRACFATILLSQGQKPAALMKICGWKNLKTMERYIRMAGIDEKGVTDSLEIMPKAQIGEVLEGTFRKD